MILTDKAREDFLKWVNLTEDMFLCAHSEREITSLTIDWFDSVGIIINVGGVIDREIKHFNLNIQQNNTLNGDEYNNFNSRKGATILGIEKANEIYNEKHK